MGYWTSKIFKVVMLPTEKAVENGIIRMDFGKLTVAKRENLGNTIFDAGVTASVYEGAYQPMNIYLISDDNINAGDVVYHALDDKVFVYKKHWLDGNMNEYGYKKVIASNDKSFEGLPLISPNVVEDYIKRNGAEMAETIVDDMGVLYLDDVNNQIECKLI